MKRIILISGIALTLAACQQETAVKEKGNSSNLRNDHRNSDRCSHPR
jgi:PBP1b-binding outer membrane lipoprotein LpoB